jgi:hypothetical protein
MEATVREPKVQAPVDPHGCAGYPGWMGYLVTALTAVAGAVGSVFSYKKGKLGRPGSLRKELDEFRQDIERLQKRAELDDNIELFRRIVREELANHGRAN